MWVNSGKALLGELKALVGDYAASELMRGQAVDVDVSNENAKKAFELMSKVQRWLHSADSTCSLCGLPAMTETRRIDGEDDQIVNYSLCDCERNN